MGKAVANTVSQFKPLILVACSRLHLFRCLNWRRVASDRIAQFQSWSIYSNATVLKMLFWALCLNMIITQKRRCFPHGQSWDLWVSKYVAHGVVAPLQEGWCGEASCTDAICFFSAGGVAVIWKRNKCTYNYCQECCHIYSWILSFLDLSFPDLYMRWISTAGVNFGTSHMHHNEYVPIYSVNTSRTPKDS